MPKIAWPYDDPYTYNTLIIGKHVIPGRAELTKGIPARRSMDVKKPKGKSGASITDNGLEPVTGIVYRIHQTKKEHHDAWQVIYQDISPAREGATNEPFEVLNAYLWERNLTNLTIVGIVCNPYDSKGKRIIEIEFDEYLPAPKPVKKGTGTPKPATTEIRAITGDLLGMSMAPGQLETVNPLANDPSKPESVQSMVGSLMGISR
jgi:hypothetical protein